MGDSKRVKKKDQASEGDGPASGGAEEVLAAVFSSLDRWVGFRYNGEGRPLGKPGSVSLFQQDGGVKVCLRDREKGLVGFVWGRGLIDALLRAEAALEEGTVDWRADRFASGPAGS